MLWVTWLSRNSARVISTVVIEQIINRANSGRPFLVWRTCTFSSLVSPMLLFPPCLFFSQALFNSQLLNDISFILLCVLVFDTHTLNYCYFSNDAYVRSKIKKITQLWARGCCLVLLFLTRTV